MMETLLHNCAIRLRISDPRRETQGAKDQEARMREGELQSKSNRIQRVWEGSPIRLAHRVLLSLAILLFLHGVARSEIQNDAIGFSSNHVFDGALKGENVDVMTGNVSLSIPIGPRYQLNDWFGSQLVLHYNSNIWEHKCPIDENLDCPGDLIGGDTYGQGVTFHFGRVYRHPEDRTGIYRYQTPDGADHFFCTSELPDCPVDGDTTVDASSIKVDHFQADEFIAYPGNGTKVILDHRVDYVREDGAGWYATRVETIAQDESGVDPVPKQRIEIQYESNSPKILNILHFQGNQAESEARRIEFTYSSDGGRKTTIIHFPWIGGAEAEYQLITESADLVDPTQSDNTTYYKRGKNLLKEIILPELSGTEKHTFSYTENGLVYSWRIPTGAEMKYHYMLYQTSKRRPYHMSMYLKTLTADGVTYRWSYTRFGEGVIKSDQDWYLQQQGKLFRGSNPYFVKVLDPFDNLTTYSFHYTPFNTGDCDNYGCRSSWDDGTLYQVNSYAGDAIDGGRLVRQMNYEYTDDNHVSLLRNAESGIPSANRLYYNVRQKQVETVSPGGTSPGGKSRTVYDGWTYGPVKKAKEIRTYDGLELYRTTYIDQVPSASFHDTYNYSELLDNSGTVLSRTDARFDADGLVCSVRRTGAGVTPLTGCDDDSLQLAPGDVATINTYDPATGDRIGITVKGGDDGAAFKEVYVRNRGVLESAQYDDPGIGWLAMDRTVDDSGMILSSRDPAGVEVEYRWDSLGRLTEILPTPPEVPTEITYVDLHETRVRQEIDADNFIESSFLYDDLGRITEERKRSIIGTYDFRRTEYDIDGQITRQSEWAAEGTADEDLSWTEYEYETFPNPNATEPGEPDRFRDPLGRVTKVVRPDGSVTETEYEGLTTIVTAHGIEGVDGPLDSTTRYRNDTFGRLVEVDSPGDGADAAYRYDESDRLLKVSLRDPLAAGEESDQDRFFEYDRLGRLRRAANPENGTVDYLAYDARGKLLDYRDATTTEFHNSWDAAGRLLSRSVSGLDLVVNQYDMGDGYDVGAAAGKMTGRTSYRIDPQSPEGTSGYHLVSEKKFAYGEKVGAPECTLAGVPAQAAYSGLNGRPTWISEKIEPRGEELRTKYCQNKMGVQSIIKYPSSTAGLRTSAEVEKVHVNGYVDRVIDLARNASYVSRIQYESHGAVKSIERSNGVVAWSYRDAMGRPTRYTVNPGGAAGDCDTNDPSGSGGNNSDPGNIGSNPSCTAPPLWNSGDYAYDGAGNVARIGSDEYFYDVLGRITSANILSAVPSTYSLSYQYDAYGNMTSRSKQISSDPVQTTTYSVHTSRNRLLSMTREADTKEFKYDPNGNMTVNGEQYNVFDSSNRLVEVHDGDGNTLAEYQYDSSGYRVRSEVGGIETYFIRDASGRVLSELKNSVPGPLGLAAEEGSPHWDKDYIYAVGQAVSMVKNRTPGRPAAPWIASFTRDGQNTASITIRWHKSPDSDLSTYRL